MSVKIIKIRKKQTDINDLKNSRSFQKCRNKKYSFLRSMDYLLISGFTKYLCLLISMFTFERVLLQNLKHLKYLPMFTSSVVIVIGCISHLPSRFSRLFFPERQLGLSNDYHLSIPGTPPVQRRSFRNPVFRNQVNQGGEKLIY